jgi:hypothetical protein
MSKYTYLPAVDLYICYQDRDEMNDENISGFVWKRVHYIRIDKTGTEDYGVFKQISYGEDSYEIGHFSLEWIEKYRVENMDDENPYENLNEKD